MLERKSSQKTLKKYIIWDIKKKKKFVISPYSN